MGADEMNYTNEGAGTPTVEIDRSIEIEIDNTIARLRDIASRLSSIHTDLEIIAAHKTNQSVYISLGSRSVYPPIQLIEMIKEKIVHALLKEKKSLHDEYHIIRGKVLPPGSFPIEYGENDPDEFNIPKKRPKR